MRSLIVILSLFMLTSCGTFANLSEGISNAREMIGDLNETYKELKPSIDAAVEGTKGLIADVKSTGEEFRSMSAEARANADKDGDGNLDWMERLAYMITLGGGAAEIARRKMKATQAQFAALTGRVDHERAKRKEAAASA